MPRERTWFEEPPRHCLCRGSRYAGAHQYRYRLLPAELSLAWRKTSRPWRRCSIRWCTPAAARFVAQLYSELVTGVRRGAFFIRGHRLAQRYLARFDTLRDPYNQHGFQGMTGSPETYNSFAAIDSGQRKRVRSG